MFARIDPTGQHWLIAVSVVIIVVAIRDLVRHIRKKPTNKDSWSGSGGYFCSNYRKELSNIAKLLSNRECRSTVHSRFSEKNDCAELYTDEFGVIAQISVYRIGNSAGKGARYGVDVRSNLSIQSEAIIRRALEFAKLNPVEFKALCL